MRLRHESLTNQEMQTNYGRMTLDEDGYVVDIEFPPADLNEIWKTQPGFLNGDVFKPIVKPKSQEQLEIEELERKLEEKKNKKRFTAADYKALIQEMLEGGATINSDGYIDMGEFNSRLRELGQRVLSGKIRRRLQDAVMAAKKEATPEPGETEDNPEEDRNGETGAV